MAEKNIPDLDALARNLADGDLLEVFATAEGENRKVPSSEIKSLRFGTILVEDNAVATTIVTQNIYAQILAFAVDGPARETTPDHANDHILIDHTGYYVIFYALSFSGGANDMYEIVPFKNNGSVPLGGKIRRKLGTGGDVGSSSAAGIAFLTAGDTVELWIRNLDGAADATLEQALLSVIQIAT